MKNTQTQLTILVCLSILVSLPGCVGMFDATQTTSMSKEELAGLAGKKILLVFRRLDGGDSGDTMLCIPYGIEGNHLIVRVLDARMGSKPKIYVELDRNRQMSRVQTSRLVNDSELADTSKDFFAVPLAEINDVIVFGEADRSGAL